ncbi:MAG: hypothetical protein WD716_04245 [Fimbriimonadaceae bacterium]
MPHRCLAFVLLFVAATATPAQSSLNVIPTAEVLSHRSAQRFYEVSGYERSADKGIYHASGLLVGVGDRAELGFDSDFLGGTAWNAKLIVYDHERGAFAIGVSDWQSGSMTKYAVGLHDFVGVRAHLGFMNDGADRPIFGLDTTTGPVTWMLDHVGGPGATTWGGASIELGTEFSVSLGRTLPASEWYATFYWTSRY